MKAFSLNLSAVTLIIASGHGSAEVIYSNLQDITIPTTYSGIHLDVDGGQPPATAPFAGWDLNPYMGGVYLANNSQFQPGRTAANDMGTIQNFAVGSTIDAGLLLGTGMGGSIDHLGTTFAAGTEGFIGFQSNGANYGWMRVVFTGNAAGAVVKDWAYDNSGAAIVTGRIQQGAASAGAQLVTLSPGIGESFTLGSQLTNTGGNTNSVLKTGGGTVTLTGSNTYTGATTITGGTLALGATASLASGQVILNGGNFNVSAVSGFTLGAGQALAGSGTVTGAVGIDGTLAIGSSPGTMTFENDLGINAGSIADFEINGFTTGNYDLAVAAAGGIQTVAFNGGTLNLSFQSGFSTAGTVRIFDFDAYTGGGFTTVNSSGLASGYTASFDPANGIVTVIPEPSAALLGGFGILALLRRRRS